MKRIIVTISLMLATGCVMAQQEASPATPPPATPPPATPPPPTPPPTTQVQAASQPPPAVGARTFPAEMVNKEVSASSSLDEILDALDARGKECKTFTADVDLQEIDAALGGAA